MSADTLTAAECEQIRELMRKVNRQATGNGTGRVPSNGMTSLVEATVVPWAPWVPEPEVCAQRVAELTLSQRHTLELLAAGYTPKQAARLRNNTLRTINHHLADVYRKLNVSSYAQGILVLHRAQSV